MEGRRKKEKYRQFHSECKKSATALALYRRGTKYATPRRRANDINTVKPVNASSDKKKRRLINNFSSRLDKLVAASFFTIQYLLSAFIIKLVMLALLRCDDTKISLIQPLKTRGSIEEKSAIPLQRYVLINVRCTRYVE